MNWKMFFKCISVFILLYSNFVVRTFLLYPMALGFDYYDINLWMSNSWFFCWIVYIFFGIYKDIKVFYK